MAETTKRVTWVLPQIGEVHADVELDRLPAFTEALELLGFDGELG